MKPISAGWATRNVAAAPGHHSWSAPGVAPFDRGITDFSSRRHGHRETGDKDDATRKAAPFDHSPFHLGSGFFSPAGFLARPDLVISDGIAYRQFTSETAEERPKGSSRPDTSNTVKAAIYDFNFLLFSRYIRELKHSEPQMAVLRFEEPTKETTPIPTDQLEQLLVLQRDTLEDVVLGKAIDDVLQQLCRASELMLPNSVASIMLFDESKAHLNVRAAPSIPPEGIVALNGLQPGPNAGSCGTAVYTEEPVFVENTMTDPRWASMVDLAKQFNLHACWSYPIRTANDTVIGSFALTSFESRAPNGFQKRLLETSSYIAGIVLERERQAQRQATVDTAFNNMREGVMVTDAKNHIIQVNRAFERITGHAASEAIGQTPKLLYSGHQDDDFYLNLHHSLAQQGEWQGEIWNRRKNGDVYPQWLSITVVPDKDPNAKRHVGVFADITETKNSERRLWQLAHHDALTDLPNRLLLMARLEHAIQRAHRTETLLAILFIDLDRFKTINDSLGHCAGDKLLKTVAQRLHDEIHEDDTVARLGGDEFVLLLEDMPDVNAVRRIASRLIDRLAAPIVIDGRALVVTASVGIGLYPKDAEDPETLMQHADAAMYRAKYDGRNRIAFYAPELTREIQRRLELEHDLRYALAHEQFVLHYQPIFSSSDGELNALEALLRWQHPKRGLIPPNDFIPVAEDTGLIADIGAWVTARACREANRWLAQSERAFSLSVNLSPYQLTTECVDDLETILRNSAFPMDRFEFEVTETLLIEEGERGLQQLTRMRKNLGMRIAMDDFGTGQSSLSQLKRLPIHKLKIDRSFVADIPDDGNDSAIVKAIILMAHTLGLEVVAEGVETIEQHKFLCASGCDHLQGFLYGRPMPAEEIGRRFRNRQMKVEYRCKAT